MPMGGVLGAAIAFGSATEFQTATDPHVHGEVHLCCIYQFNTLAEIAERIKEGLSIQAVSSSIRSENQAKEGGIPFADIDTITTVDMTVDGADEIKSSCATCVSKRHI